MACAGGCLVGAALQEFFDEPTWTFAREADELTISRRITRSGVILSLSLNSEAAREYDFPDLSSAMRRQAEIEASLLQFGWSFVGFLPQRRSLDERRTSHRDTDDRRRWWTNGYLFGIDLE
jgi:hypothetical protein